MKFATTIPFQTITIPSLVNQFPLRVILPLFPDRGINDYLLSLNKASLNSDVLAQSDMALPALSAIPAFNVMDLSLSYNWRTFTFYTGVNNLADKKYFTRPADGYPGPGILPADKRNLYLTVQLKLRVCVPPG